MPPAVIAREVTDVLHSGLEHRGWLRHTRS